MLRNVFLGFLIVLTIAVTIAAGVASLAVTANQIEQVRRIETVTLMPPEAMRSMIRQAAASWSEGDAKAVAKLFVPEGEFVVPGQKVVGPAAIEKVASEFFDSHSHVDIEVQRIIVEGQQAVVEWTWTDTENDTGKRSCADDAIVVDFADGKIRRWREYIDAVTPKTQPDREC